MTAAFSTTLRIPKLSRSLVRELLWQWQRHRRRSASILMLGGGLAVYALATSWQQTYGAITHREQDAITFRLGILELRLKEHLLQSQIWSQDDELQAFVEGRSGSQALGSLRRAIEVGDQQVAIILNPEGKILLQEPKPILSPGLKDCIEQRVSRFRTLSNHRPYTFSAGLYCSVGHEEVLGAISSIGTNQHTQHPIGYVVHLSPLQSKGFTPAVQSWFQNLSKDLQIHAGTAHHQPVGDQHINDLLPENQHLDLKQDHTSRFNLATEAAQRVLLPWLLSAATSLYLIATLLLAIRHRRLRSQRQQLKEIRLRRGLRKQLRAMLVSPRQLQHALDNPDSTTSNQVIACIDVAVPWSSNGTSDLLLSREERILYEIIASLRQSLLSPLISRIDSNKLVVIEDPGANGQAVEQLQFVLSEACSQICMDSSKEDEPVIRAVVSELDRSQGSLQIRDMLFELSALPLKSTIQIRRVHDHGATTSSSSTSTSDYDETWLELVGENFHDQHVSLLFRSGGSSTLYKRLAFNPLSQLIEQRAAAAFLPLRMLTQSKDSPAVERLMIREALRKIQESANSLNHLICLSGKNLANASSFKILMDELKDHSSETLSRLILEFEAVSLLAASGYGRQQIKQLKELGVSISIDDTAIDAPPIKAIFTLKPDYLIVGPGLVDQFHDPNAENIVDFLLAYCRYKHCLLVMTEVTSAETLTYWNNRGVKAFEGEHLDGLAA